MEKSVPSGYWIHLKNLPAETTDSQIAEHFCKCGIPITEEWASVRAYPTNATAVVSIPKEELLALVEWALHSQDFAGRKLTITRFGKDTEKAAKVRW
jgi:hypothetical protein